MTSETPAGEWRRSPLGPYRVRGHRSGRLEAFSDAVFGFSATLLVVSLEVPQTFIELAASLKGFVAFGLSFLALVFIWLAHRGFFRRYGLNDSWVTFLNMVLLFVVLFFVYPLKFLSVSFVERVLGISARSPAGAVVERFASSDEVNALFVIYGLGFAAVFLCFSLLYRRALACRRQLDLTAIETYDARTIVWHYQIMVGMALFSVLLTLAGVGQRLGGVSGWIYGMLGPLMTVFWVLRSKRRDALSA